ncbi:MAG: hypothetical protein HQK79_08640 [Desulfobacterales bacterium]|nr:hypothetical protein [Desulfobacterales bacterium]
MNRRFFLLLQKLFFFDIIFLLLFLPGCNPTVSITAESQNIFSGQATTLTWATTNATKAVIDNGIGEVLLNGKKTVTPTETTIYTITVTNQKGITVKASVKITVTSPKPTIEFTANPATILKGSSTNLSWKSENATKIIIDQGIGEVSNTGIITISPQKTTCYTITATGKGGMVSSIIIVTVTYPQFSIKITYPIDKAVISGNNVMIQGEITNSIGKEVGIIVNGATDKIAMVNGDKFVANHVPLKDGENTIAVTAVDSEKNIAKSSVIINTAPIDNYIQLLNDLESGILPFETIIKLKATFVFSNKPYISYTGNGNVEIIETQNNSEYKVKIAAKGIYYLTVEALDEQNNSYTDTIAIQVFDQSEFDALLREKWEGMREALKKHNINAAADFFDYSTKDAYKKAFASNPDLLSDMAEKLNDIQFINSNENSCEYDIRAIKDGKEYSFYLLFVKDKDGIWKIKSF